MSPENRAADQGTIRANKLELVERLADDLAHEIKNPLHSMVINLEVLRRRLARLDTEPQGDLLRYAGILGAELERVNRRVDLLLRMVRPTRDSEDRATLTETVEELRELLELECQRHGVTLEISPPRRIATPDLPKAPMRQILLSLMLETLDRTPRGGTLRLVADESDDAARIHIYATADHSPPPPSGDQAANSFLTVARSLAERLGGTLEPLAADLDDARGDLVQVGFSLALPSGVRGPRTGNSNAPDW